MSDSSSCSGSRTGTRSRSRSRSPIRQRRGRFPGARNTRGASPVVEVTEAEVHVQPESENVEAVVQEVLVDDATRQLFAIQQNQQSMLAQLQAQ